MLPEDSTANIVLWLDDAPLRAEPIFAVIIDDVRLDLAGEVPRLLRRLGDVAALIVGIQPAGGATLLQVVEAITDIQIFRRQHAHRFEQSPFAAHAEAEAIV